MTENIPISKEVWIGWFSSLVEAYNMALYGFAAPLLAGLLFQNQASGAALFYSYALVLIAAGIFYPLGAIYFGAMGDREGRQKICVYSTLGLGFATGLMGLVPFFDGAWVVFLILICGQYFFSGGEYYSSIIFSLEHATIKQTGLLSALSCLFAVFGIACANGFTVLSQDLSMVRLAFLFGAGGGILSYLLKNHCRETPPFVALAGQNKISTKTFILQEWPRILSGTLSLGFFWVSYTFIFFVLPLLPLEAHSHFDTFKSLLVYGVLLVASGFLADKVGLHKMVLAGLTLFGITVIPLVTFFQQLLPIQLALTACACLVIGPVHSWLLALFPPATRCRGVFFSYALSASLFAGSTVPICLVLFERSGSLLICALYPTLVAFSAWIWLLCYHPVHVESRDSS